MFINVAVIALYSLSDKDLLELSSHTVASCTYEQDDIRVINMKTITEVIVMVPHCPRLPSGVQENRYFMAEKPGLDIATFGIPGDPRDVEDEEDDNHNDNTV
ncbi:uncharacterized protein F5891DRAFT_963509 [Suillus fuscotomentosus]|uniref:Uncharacterized protein n=1 Tax=Suillus fuscotomentosus TaxID=1912939 RepID=A0AAD4DSE0_9AGAM|nr:uncharacterized protein F5891DRAFT_963509 [Suillus fuscotomentosus]KAG1893060.1 hypothetical protein F5891DRAFT_963509 [Suillus fuscotomentosus]